MLKGIKKHANVYYCALGINIQLDYLKSKTLFGNKVKAIMTFERTICDFVKTTSRKQISEIFSKLISAYIKYENRDWKKLYEYCLWIRHTQKNIGDIWTILWIKIN
nr:hypothetical protein [Mycoplasmopsis bovis]